MYSKKIFCWVLLWVATCHGATSPDLEKLLMSLPEYSISRRNTQPMSSLIGYSCQGPNTTTVTIALNKVEQCKEPDVEPTHKVVNIQYMFTSVRSR